jgi:hypothetical protein
MCPAPLLALRWQQARLLVVQVSGVRAPAHHQDNITELEEAGMDVRSDPAIPTVVIAPERLATSAATDIGAAALGISRCSGAQLNLASLANRRSATVAM